jgi:peptidoglycan/xylan/chitin deacetylase (PgdA/CDA1 family)
MDIVLLYHRVAPASQERSCVSLSHFSQQLDVLAADADIVPLTELIDRRGTAGRPPRVAITFDDGYGNNVTHALSELEQRAAPATVFVTTGKVGSTREFWWDELEWLIRHGRFSVEFTVDGDTWKCELPAVGADDGAEAGRPASAAGEERVVIFEQLHSRLRGLGAPAERVRVLDAMVASLHVAIPVRPERLPLSGGQLLCLSQHPLIDIGAHTVDHVDLLKCSREDQERQIVDSKRRVDDVLGTPAIAFAYPFGFYSSETVRLVQRAGFRLACAVGNRVVGGENELEISRLCPGDWDGEVFASRLHALAASH